MNKAHDSCSYDKVGTGRYAKAMIVGSLTFILSACAPTHYLTRPSDKVTAIMPWKVPEIQATYKNPLCSGLEKTSPLNDTPVITNRSEKNALVKFISNSDCSPASSNKDLPVLLSDGIFPKTKLRVSFDSLVFSNDSAEAGFWDGHPAESWSADDNLGVPLGYSSIKNFAKHCVKEAHIEISPIGKPKQFKVNAKVDFFSPVMDRQYSGNPVLIKQGWMKNCSCTTIVDEQFSKCFEDRAMGLLANIGKLCNEELGKSDKDESRFSCTTKGMKFSELSLETIKLTKYSRARIQSLVRSPVVTYPVFLQRARGLRANVGTFGERVNSGEFICVHGGSFASAIRYSSGLLSRTKELGSTECYRIVDGIPLSGQSMGSLGVDPLQAWYPLGSIERVRKDSYSPWLPRKGAHNVISEPEAIGRRGKIEKKTKVGTKLTPSSANSAMYLVRKLPLRLEAEAFGRAFDSDEDLYSDEYPDELGSEKPYTSAVITSRGSLGIDYLIDRWGSQVKCNFHSRRKYLDISEVDENFVNADDRWKEIYGDVKDCNGLSAPIYPPDRFRLSLFAPNNDPYVAFNIYLNDRLLQIRTGTTLHTILHSVGAIGSNSQQFFPVGEGLSIAAMPEIIGNVKLSRRDGDQFIDIILDGPVSMQQTKIPLLPGDRIIWNQ